MALEMLNINSQGLLKQSILVEIELPVNKTLIEKDQTAVFFKAPINVPVPLPSLVAKDPCSCSLIA